MISLRHDQTQTLGKGSHWLYARTRAVSGCPELASQHDQMNRRINTSLCYNTHEYKSLLEYAIGISPLESVRREN